MLQSTRQSVLFRDLFGKRTKAVFDAEATSSDGGVALLAAVDRRIGLTASIAEHAVDPRDPARIQHEWIELFRQRVYSIALGYADQNDARTLRGDPVLKGAAGREPVWGDDLASQPTISRFENSVDASQLVAMLRRLEGDVLDRVAARHPDAERVVIDLDPSCDPTHGSQQLALFNGFYRTWCYLPVFGTIQVEGDPEQYVFCARLRPGRSTAGRTSLRTVRRVVGRLRKLLPDTEILVRLDSGFATPRLFTLLDELGVRYVVGMPKNSKLVDACAAELETSRERAAAEESTAQEYGELEYRTRSWERARRVVFKAEVLVAEGKVNRDNPRFVVTNLPPECDAKAVYTEVYCGRDDAENRIKELKYGLSVDRTSDTSFCANQLRVLMSAVAYVLFQELRVELRGTEAESWQVGTIRERLLKIGTRVVESVRRVVLHMAAGYPWQDLWCRVARRLGAAPV